jgi:asparagine synthase (glutamine-hydrolysing)
MCGIAGVLNTTLASDLRDLSQSVRAMADTMVHRGPDDWGVWESPDRLVALAHRRLSIVDLSPLGRNPMLWDGGRLVISFNGEIYNFQDLRAELEQRGHVFRSHTDTEVILAAYDEWGIDCVHRFAGMFAIALWDATRRRLWLVRDRIGKKPLYYFEQNGALWFASELKALLRIPGFDRTPDMEAIRLYFKYGYVPSPFSIFTAARKLPPAHQLICEGGRLSITRYWDPLACVGTATAISDDDAEGEFESLLSTAVRQRRIADVPLGAFLSGGIDSSLIVALMSEQSGKPVETYTIRFANPEFNEADHAAGVARHLGTNHHDELCDERQMLAIVDGIPDMFDEPFGDSSAIPTHLVSRMARKTVTVALSGDGGDELFFGYQRYRLHADFGWVFSLPAPARKLAALVARRLPGRDLQRLADILGNDGTDSYTRFVTWWTPTLITALSGGPAAQAALYQDLLDRAKTPGVPSGLLDLVSYLPEDILTKVDRASMAVSLEVRAPLLDHRVVEFSLGLPLRLKRRGRTSKWLLRRLLYKRVPSALVDRPKMGFSVPMRDWLLGPLRERMEDHVYSDDLGRLGLNPAPAQRVWEEFKRGHAHRPDLLWQLFVLVAWSRRFLTAAGVGAHASASAQAGRQGSAQEAFS